MVKPFLVGSDSAGGFPHLGAEVLRRGGSALDAVEATIRAVESNTEDHGVGLGGIPNLLGQVQPEASFMDGRTRAAGCVAAVEEYLHVISIARKVIEISSHTSKWTSTWARRRLDEGSGSGSRWELGRLP